MTADEFDRETEQFVKLCEFDDDRQRDIVLELLKKEAIPAFTRDIGAGNYVRIVTGGSIFGSKLYVPISCRAQAAQILASVQPENGVPFDERDLNAAYDAYMQQNPQRAQIEEEPEDADTSAGYHLLKYFLIVFGLLIAAGLIYLATR